MRLKLKSLVTIILLSTLSHADTPPPTSILKLNAGTCGGYVKGSAGLLACNALIPISDGGTGQSTQSGALNALLPSQASQGGKYLVTDGTNATWGTVSGSGSVTSASVVSANGFAGTVATPTTTPAITLTTSVTGIVKGNGTALSAATLGTDYSAGTSGLATGIVKSTTATGALSIALSSDFPTLNQSTTGTASNITATSNATLTTLSALSLPYSQLSGTVPTWNQNTTGSSASFTGSLLGDVTGTQGATVVGKINGTALSALGTGILKNTTTTGVPSIAIASDFPTLNQNTTGTASNVTGTVAIANGGTSVTSVTSTPTATSFAGWDANKNFNANSYLRGVTTTATAAGTTTLTVASAQLQRFTGTTTQTVVLPDATTMLVGGSFIIANRSTGVVTVNANGGGLLLAMPAGSLTTFTLTVNSPAAGTWDFTATSGGGSGITRSINSISTATTLAATALTDYVYLVSGTTTITMPTAVSNTNRYTIKNTDVSTVTVVFTSAQTADGSASLSLTPNTSIELISDSSNWRIL